MAKWLTEAGTLWIERLLLPFEEDPWTKVPCAAI